MEMLTLKVWGWYEYLIEDKVQRHILAFAVLNRPVLLRRCNQLLWKVLIINFLNRISRLALFVKCKASETCSVFFVRYGGIWSRDIVVRNINIQFRLLMVPSYFMTTSTELVPHERLIFPCLVKRVPRFIEPKIHYRIHKSPRSVLILNQINSVHVRISLLG
jgi:hypothetical protein